jgi:glycerophosphoryl diester phosphodiesterase
MTPPRERTLVGRTAISVLVAATVVCLASPPAFAQPSYQTTLSFSAARRAGEPMVIAHRGASGYRPEHTIGAYRLAILQGADYIEPDLVATKDGSLVARHENEISGTTDVASHPEFARRRTTKVIDGERETGWFTEDFTLGELRTLRTRERVPGIRPHNTRYNGRWQIPSFRDILRLARQKSRDEHRPIGVCPEIKHSRYFRQLGLPIEGHLVAALKEFGRDRAHSPTCIQSFETGNLHRLNKMTDVRLIQIMERGGAPDDLVARGSTRTYADMATSHGLAKISRYADGIAAGKGMVIARNPRGFLQSRSNLVRDAHRVGLRVFAWTFRNENRFLPKEFRKGGNPNAKGLPRGEYRAYFDAGVDGVFTDFPDTAVEARRAFR